MKNLVSMPSRAYTSFLLSLSLQILIFYQYRVNALSGLYLISTAEAEVEKIMQAERVNALSGLYLISTDRFK